MQRQESPLNLEEDGQSNDLPQEIRQEIAVADEKNPIVTTTHPEIKDVSEFCKIVPEIERTPVYKNSSYMNKVVTTLSFNQELEIEPYKKTIKLYQNKKCISKTATPYLLQGITVIDENQFAIVGYKPAKQEPLIYTIEIWKKTPENKLNLKESLGCFYDRPYGSHPLHAINTGYLIYKGNLHTLLINIQTKQFIRLPSTFYQQYHHNIGDLHPLIDGQTFYCVLSTDNSIRSFIHALLIRDDISIKLYSIRETRSFTQLYLLQNGCVGNLEESTMTYRRA